MATPLFISRRGTPDHKFPAVLDTTVPAPFIPYDDSRPRLTRAILLLPVLWFNSAIMPEGPKPDIIKEETAQQVTKVKYKGSIEYPNLLTSQDQLPVSNKWEIQNRLKYRKVEDSQSRLLLDSGPAPFIPEDWSTYRLTDKTTAQNWFNSAIMPLPTSPQVANPFIPEDWSTATKKLTRQDQAIQSRLILETALVVPFLSSDWSQQRKQFRVDVPASQVSLSITLPLVQNNLPFRDINWDLPNRNWNRILPQSWFNSGIMPLPTSPPIINPIVPVDWTPQKKLVRTIVIPDRVPLLLTLPAQPPQDQVMFREALLLHVERLAPRIQFDPGQSRLNLETAPVNPFFGVTTLNAPLPIRASSHKADQASQSRLVVETPPANPFFGITTETAPLPDRMNLSWDQNLLENTLGLAIIPPIVPIDVTIAGPIPEKVEQALQNILVLGIPPIIPPPVVLGPSRSHKNEKQRYIDWSIPFVVNQEDLKDVTKQIVVVRAEIKENKKEIDYTSNIYAVNAISNRIDILEEKLALLLEQKEALEELVNRKVKPKVVQDDAKEFQKFLDAVLEAENRYLEEERKKQEKLQKILDIIDVLDNDEFEEVTTYKLVKKKGK